MADRHKSRFLVLNVGFEGGSGIGFADTKERNGRWGCSHEENTIGGNDVEEFSIVGINDLVFIVMWEVNLSVEEEFSINVTSSFDTDSRIGFGRERLWQVNTRFSSIGEFGWL
jgi:hypothetical protein